MPHLQITRATLRLRLQEKYESVPFWTATESNRAINECLRRWNLYTCYWKRKVVLPTTAGDSWYTVPSTLIYQLRMTFNGFPLTPSSVFSMDQARPGWEGETTASGGVVPPRPKFFIPAGLNLFAIWPADAVGGGSLEVDGVRQTPVLTADGDFLDIGQEELGYLLGEMLHILSFKTPSFLATTQKYHQQFLIAAAQRNSILKASAMLRRAMGLDQGREQRPQRVPAQAAGQEG